MKPDRRVIKSEKSIQSAFSEMLMEIGFDAITVKDIAERADISRKTFYLHYVDKYDLFNAIVTEQLEGLRSLCECQPRREFGKCMQLWFHYFEEHKALFAALFSTGSTVFFRQQLLEFVIFRLSEILEKTAPEKSTEVLRRFMGMAVIGVIESYVLDDLNAGTDEVAEQVSTLLKKMVA